jgi:D-alanyl-D-alanine carboxypeptidase
VTTATAGDLGATYHGGCPVGPASLRMLHMSYWGFDNAAHVGAMVVNVAVAQPVLTVFATLFRAHFPIRRMVTVDGYGGSDDASMAADNTSAFNCRTVANSTNWSEHAYGEAIDVNTVENPYLVDGTVEPPAGRAYLDRNPLGPGMAGPGSLVNNAFASIGWPWGGRFHSPDYQHFSKSGR